MQNLMLPLSGRAIGPARSKAPLLIGALCFTLAPVAATAGAPEPRPLFAPTSTSAQGPTLEDRIHDLERKLSEHEGEPLRPPAPPKAPAPPSTDFAPSKLPFTFADFSWAPANYSGPDHPFTFGPFAGELRVDVPFHYVMTHPQDNTISGSTEAWRSNEIQVTQLGFGGDFYYKGMMARLMTQFGMLSTTTPRNDASPARGQWSLDNAYRYLSEAYAGYHIDALYGINIQAGIFMSYIGLWSYYNFDNWTYQPSYVSSNTPWFFNGMRIQIYTDEHLKIEPWIINGWQSYGKFNDAPGLGLQVLWRPNSWLSILGNQYFGTDTLGTPDRKRIHTDDSIMVKYYDAPGHFLNKAAFSVTIDAGGEWGDGMATLSNQHFLGFMAYNRFWFLDDLFAFTGGGGFINNPGRYLVLLPPINGATAATGSPYFSANPGDEFNAWDCQLTFDIFPVKYTVFRFEYVHRHADQPYFSGNKGVTPPDPNTSGNLTNNGNPRAAVLANGNPSTRTTPMPGDWFPDLVKSEDRITVALLVRL